MDKINKKNNMFNEIKKCINWKDKTKDPVILGKGDFGLVIQDPNDKNAIIKISRLSHHIEKENFKREIYFLTKLKHTSLVPLLLKTKLCDLPGNRNIFGIQWLERFDGSMQQLGTDQALHYFNISPTKRQVAFTANQIVNMFQLVNELDHQRILHQDLKKANILQRHNGQIMTLADFGFSAEMDEPRIFTPLQGFLRHFGCATDLIKYPIPSHLIPYMNRFQLFTDITKGRKLWIINEQTHKKEKLNVKRLSKWINLSPAILSEFKQYCNHHNNK